MDDLGRGGVMREVMREEGEECVRRRWGQRRSGQQSEELQRNSSWETMCSNGCACTTAECCAAVQAGRIDGNLRNLGWVTVAAKEMPTLRCAVD